MSHYMLYEIDSKPFMPWLPKTHPLLLNVVLASFEPHGCGEAFDSPPKRDAGARNLGFLETNPVKTIETPAFSYIISII